MLVHLSDTLEVRSYLNRAKAKNDLTLAALESIEKFCERLINGPFRLRTEEETTSRLEALRETLASLSLVEPHSIDISTQSQRTLLGADPVGQMLIYSVAESGSVARVLESTPAHRACREKLPVFKIDYQGETRNIGIERRLRTLLNSNGLKQVLRGSLYGASFTKLFEKSIVSYYTHLFAHAMADDIQIVEKMLPLSTLFRSNMPIARYPKEAGQATERWLLFVE